MSRSRANKELGASILPGAMPKCACLRPGCPHTQVGGRLGCDGHLQPLGRVPSPPTGQSLL